MNSPAVSERPNPLPLDRIGSIVVHGQAGRSGDLRDASRPKPGDRGAFGKEWIVAMTAAAIIVTLVIAVKFAWFVLFYPGATAR